VLGFGAPDQATIKKSTKPLDTKQLTKRPEDVPTTWFQRFRTDRLLADLAEQFPPADAKAPDALPQSGT
jgi:hypothetical protein